MAFSAQHVNHGDFIGANRNILVGDIDFIQTALDADIVPEILIPLYKELISLYNQTAVILRRISKEMPDSFRDTFNFENDNDDNS